MFKQAWPKRAAVPRDHRCDEDEEGTERDRQRERKAATSERGGGGRRMKVSEQCAHGWNGV